LQTLCVVPAPLTSTSFTSSAGPELQYLEQDVRFFQLWALNADLGLDSTLLSVHRSDSEEISRPRLLITAPPFKLTQSLRPQGPQFAKDSFIVADGMDDEHSLGNGYTFHDSRVHSTTGRNRDDLRFRLNWKVIFQQVFGLSNVQIENDDEVAESAEDGEQRLKEFLDRAFSHIQEGIKEEKLACNSLYVKHSCLLHPSVLTLSRHEIIGISGPSGDIEPAAARLRQFLDALRQVYSPEETSTFNFVLSDLTACPAIQFPLEQATNHPDPKIVFNQLIDNWMASLPRDVSNKARLSKFNIIRQTAVELYLSSFAVSLRNKATDVNIGTVQNDQNDLTLPEPDTEYGTTRESSPVNFSSQQVPFPRNQPVFSLPTPAQTPSLYSRATSASEYKEDLAITRLRQYAVFIKPKPDFGKSTILSQWPSNPGSDPANYSWEAKQKGAEEDQNDAEREQRNRKEEARRRKRTEKFLNQERGQTAEATPQPMVVNPSGSQPVVAHNGFSSQTVEDVPMTQPDRGAFGSRSVQKSKKAKKHRTAGF
jgi:RNA polymerase I-specific transcription initiation factor RRN6